MIDLNQNKHFRNDKFTWEMLNKYPEVGEIRYTFLGEKESFGFEWNFVSGEMIFGLTLERQKDSSFCNMSGKADTA